MASLFPAFPSSLSLEIVRWLRFRLQSDAAFSKLRTAHGLKGFRFPMAVLAECLWTELSKGKGWTAPHAAILPELQAVLSSFFLPFLQVEEGKMVRRLGESQQIAAVLDGLLTGTTDEARMLQFAFQQALSRPEGKQGLQVSEALMLSPSLAAICRTPKQVADGLMQYQSLFLGISMTGTYLFQLPLPDVVCKQIDYYFHPHNSNSFFQDMLAANGGKAPLAELVAFPRLKRALQYFSGSSDPAVHLQMLQETLRKRDCMNCQVTADGASVLPLTRPTRILRQVNYYFSDAVYARDSHLKGLAREDADGWIPITALVTFNRLAAMEAKPEELALACRESTVVQISKDGMFIRKIFPASSAAVAAAASSSSSSFVTGGAATGGAGSTAVDNSGADIVLGGLEQEPEESPEGEGEEAADTAAKEGQMEIEGTGSSGQPSSSSPSSPSLSSSSPAAPAHMSPALTQLAEQLHEVLDHVFSRKHLPYDDALLDALSGEEEEGEADEDGSSSSSSHMGGAAAVAALHHHQSVSQHVGVAAAAAGGAGAVAGPAVVAPPSKAEGPDSVSAAFLFFHLGRLIEQSFTKPFLKLRVPRFQRSPDMVLQALFARREQSGEGEGEGE